MFFISFLQKIKVHLRRLSWRYGLRVPARFADRHGRENLYDLWLEANRFGKRSREDLQLRLTQGLATNNLGYYAGL